tara:strand:+ start:1536 stop:2147 length:612 start_codon:yes stop_codon:yes gene_type:complete
MARLLDRLMDDYSSGQHSERTYGKYKTEKDAEKGFDDAIEKSGLFKIYKQRPGKYIQPQCGKTPPQNGFRIDRLLLPQEGLLKLPKWQNLKCGVIGVEIKKSDIKIGPPLAQLLDYTRAEWNLVQNVKVRFDFGFLWPTEKTHNTTASIMAQNRLGAVYLQYPSSSQYHRLCFTCGEQNFLRYYYQTQTIEIGKAFGERTGSR